MRQRVRVPHLLILALLLLLAYAVRLYRLDFQSLWWDEGISLHLATSSLSEIIRDRQNNIHPPLYFFILKGWLALVGVSTFTGRYLSALASLGQVAIIFSAVGYWVRGDRKDRKGTPWMAALFMLIAPLSVIYGQEIRVYALLPVVYVLLLLLAEIYLSNPRTPHRILIILAMVEWFGLHLHYIAVFAVAYIGLWGLLVFLRRRDVESLRRWIIAHALVGVASLPWLLGVIRNWTAIQAEANAGTFTTSPVPFGYLLAQVWAFHLTGLAGALSSDFVRIVSTVALVLFAGLLIYRAAVNRRNQATNRGGDVTFRLVRHWIAPLAAGLAVWSVRSFSHPRYITMFAVMLIPAAVFLMLRNRHWLARAAAVGLALCMILLSFWGLGRYFFGDGAAKPDMRGVARYLESVTRPGDMILIPDTDWSLPFEYRGEATVIMPRIDESPFEAQSTLARALDCREGSPCAESGRVFTVEYERGTRDWQNRLPFELARRGYRIGVTSFEDLSVREYWLTGPSGPLPECGSEGMARQAYTFGSLDLEAAWLPVDVASDTAVTVALCWRLNAPTTEAMTASLVLTDPVTGERIAQADTLLVDSVGAPSQHWPVGEPVTTYHVLPLSQGTPPIESILQVGVYGDAEPGSGLIEAVNNLGNPVGELVSLGDVQLSSPVGLAGSAYDAPLPPLWDEPVPVADGLLLAGTSVNPGPYRPGQTIRVALIWLATDPVAGDLTPVLLLEQGGEVLDSNDDLPVNGRYPVERWRPGQYVSEYRDLRAPAGAEGMAHLTIQAGDNWIDLGQITIEGSGLLLERPPVSTPANVRFGDAISLAGFDPPPENLQPAMPVPLTLYWESLTARIQTGYVVFTHLLAEDGRLIAQHDSPPANGQRPTDEWLMGEFIIDPHELEWRETNYTGPARLSVGLYDPATGERLKLADGTDSFILPVEFYVKPAP